VGVNNTRTISNKECCTRRRYTQRLILILNLGGIYSNHWDLKGLKGYSLLPSAVQPPWNSYDVKLPHIDTELGNTQKKKHDEDL
jgi:hypothetical protein